MATKEMRKRKQVKKHRTHKARKQRGGENKELEDELKELKTLLDNVKHLSDNVANNKKKIKEICEKNSKPENKEFNEFVLSLQSEYGEIINDCINNSKDTVSDTSNKNKDNCIIS